LIWNRFRIKHRDACDTTFPQLTSPSTSSGSGAPFILAERGIRILRLGFDDDSAFKLSPRDNGMVINSSESLGSLSEVYLRKKLNSRRAMRKNDADHEFYYKNCQINRLFQGMRPFVCSALDIDEIGFYHFHYS
jgi:hypothetical protein